MDQTGSSAPSPRLLLATAPEAIVVIQPKFQLLATAHVPLERPTVAGVRQDIAEESLAQTLPV